MSTTCSSDRLALLAGGSLQISNLTEEDAGIYTCTADNGNQTIQAQAELIVQGKGVGDLALCVPVLFILLLKIQVWLLVGW